MALSEYLLDDLHHCRGLLLSFCALRGLCDDLVVSAHVRLIDLMHISAVECTNDAAKGTAVFKTIISFDW